MTPRQLAALCAVADALEGAGGRWLLAGSAGRALLRAPVRPRDIDLELDPAGADRAAAALGAALAPADGAGRRSRRASIHRAGVEVDLTCDLGVDGPGGALAPDFALQWEWSHPVTICGRAIRIAPPEETLVRAIALGDWAGVAKVAGQTAAAEPPPALRRAYVSARLSPETSSATR